MFGWTSVTHKESFRWLTQDLLQPETIPQIMRDSLTELTHEMDKLMLNLVSSTASVLFKKHLELLGKDYDIPLLKSESPKWSMFDIAYYLNDQQKFVESELEVDENCAPHYDPGLLSLSILSTHRGLELYDPLSDQWIPHTGEDKSLAILWCGKAALEASDGTLRPAVHKVIRQLDKPRLALWYEICTSNQVPPISQPELEATVTKKITQPKPVEEPSIWNLFGLMSGSNNNNSNNQQIKPTTNKKQNKKSTSNINLIKLEKTTGVPMTKALRLEETKGIPITKSL